MNNLYPVFFDLQEKNCLVAGAGSVALRKIETLLLCDARVTVVAVQSLPAVRALQEEGRIELRRRGFQDADVNGMTLVIAATDDAIVNRAISDAARREGIPCNVVDVPELCDFHVPAVVARGDLKIAVSTGGKSPAFAARVRTEIEANVSDRYAEALRVLGAFRAELREAPGIPAGERNRVLQDAVNSEQMNSFLAGNLEKLEPEKWK